jgi:superfamily II DNA helicase RecQ
MLPPNSLDAALRQWRSQQATQENRPLRSIITDRAIHQLIDSMPANDVELGSIHGLDSIKLEQYGPHLLKLIKPYRNG